MTGPISERETTWKLAKEILAEGDRRLSHGVKESPIRYCYQCGTQLQERLKVLRWFDETTGQRRTERQTICPKCNATKPFFGILKQLFWSTCVFAMLAVGVQFSNTNTWWGPLIFGALAFGAFYLFLVNVIKKFPSDSREVTAFIATAKEKPQSDEAVFSAAKILLSNYTDDEVTTLVATPGYESKDPNVKMLREYYGRYGRATFHYMLGDALVEHDKEGWRSNG